METRRWIDLVVAFSVSVGVLAACRSEGEEFVAPSPFPIEQSTAGQPSASPNDSVSVASTQPAYGAWVTGLPPHPLGYLAGYQIIVIGRLGPFIDMVHTQAGLDYLETFESGGPICPPPGNPKYEACISEGPPKPSLFRYSFQVEDVASGNLSRGDSIQIIAAGESKDVILDGCSVGHTPTLVDVMEPGRTYLLFLTDVDRGFQVQAFGRFVIDDEGYLRPAEDVWSGLPEVAKLSGLTTREAIAAIAEANADWERILAAPPTSYQQPSCPGR